MSDLVSEITIRPPGHGLRGHLRVPGDKSISHRAVLMAARAKGRSALTGLSEGEDVTATLRAARVFGAGIAVSGGVVTISGQPNPGEPDSVIDVGNSGTGIRLLAGWVAGINGLTVLHGDASIARRPMGRIAEPLRFMGARIDGRQGGCYPPLVIRGGDLQGIEYRPPVASAQVKGAILLAGLSAGGPTTVIEEVPTRAHTEELLPLFGGRVEVSGGRVTAYPGGLHGAALDVPGDPSQAAFWVVAACATPGSDLTIEKVYVGPGRAGFLDVLRRMGADLEVTQVAPGVADIRASYSPLKATEVSGAEVPGLIDEIPVLAVAAARADGVTTFSGAAELKVKESDRIATTVAALNSLGAEAEGADDGLSVKGMAGRPFTGGVVDSAGDHRIAMAAAVAALSATGPVRITGWEAVATSYPRFEEDLASCGS